MNPAVTYIFLHNRVPALTYRFTADQFHRLADLGILVWGDRSELIHGQIVTQGVPRRFTVEEFDRMAEAGVLTLCAERSRSCSSRSARSFPNRRPDRNRIK